MKLLAGKTILVVDDERMLREIISEEFTDKGAEVVTAENGRQAFKIVLEKRIDLIVSDLRMPEGDGIELLKNVKSYNRTTPKFIILSGYFDLNREEAYARGACALLTKPFDPEEVTKRIATFFIDPVSQYQSPNPGMVEICIKAQNDADAEKKGSFRLGQGGVFISAKNGMPKEGTQIHLRLAFKELKKDICAMGTVLWCRPLSSGDLAAGFGVQFSGYPEETKKWQEEILAKTKPLAYIPKS